MFSRLPKNLLTTFLLSALLACAGTGLSAPKSVKATAKTPTTPMAAKPMVSKPVTATAAPASKLAGRGSEIGRLDAVRLGVGSIEKTQTWNRALFPVATQFQDPRRVVVVPSPDGKKLVWRGLDKKGYCLFMSDSNGKNEKRLDACKNGYQPTWSDDGKKILFSAMDWRIEARNLFLYDIASGKTLRAFNAKKKVGPLASLSPDGKKVLFNYFDDLWLMNSNGIGRSLLNVSGKLGKPIADAELIAWSKDGASFSYKMRGDDAVYVVYLSSKI